MSELDDFLRWGASFGKANGERDMFGRLVDHNYPKFPYGEISAWIAEYRYAQSRRQVQR